MEDKRKKISRRDFLKISSLGVGTAALVGCSQAATESAGGEEDVPVADVFTINKISLEQFFV